MFQKGIWTIKIGYFFGEFLLRSDVYAKSASFTEILNDKGSGADKEVKNLQDESFILWLYLARPFCYSIMN